MGFTNFLYGVFSVVAIVNPPDGKLVKFKFSKKATKLSIITSNQVGDYFKFLWPFQNVRNCSAKIKASSAKVLDVDLI